MYDVLSHFSDLMYTIFKLRALTSIQVEKNQQKKIINQKINKDVAEFKKMQFFLSRKKPRFNRPKIYEHCKRW